MSVDEASLLHCLWTMQVSLENILATADPTYVRRTLERNPFLDEADYRRAVAEFNHKFSSTQVNLSAEYQAELRRWVAEYIPTDDLSTEESQDDDFHITVKYGLHTDDAELVKALLDGRGPIKATLGKVSAFTDAPDWDVLLIEVDSVDLVEFNRMLSDELPHTDTHDEYHPHVTLAYVKKGMASHLIGDKSFAGRAPEFDSVRFSSAKDDIGVTDIPLAKGYAFCPTGEGGGIDNSCSSSDGEPSGSSSTKYPRTTQEKIDKTFGDWGATRDGNIFGYRGANSTGTNLGKIAATEGEGLYIAKSKELAEQFGAPQSLSFSIPKNPLIVDEEPLHILLETDEIMGPPSKSDSPWLAANKEAVKRAGVTDDNWPQKIETGELSEALSQVLRDNGYDSVYVKSGGEERVVLIAPTPGGKVKTKKEIYADIGAHYFVDWQTEDFILVKAETDFTLSPNEPVKRYTKASKRVNFSAMRRAFDKGYLKHDRKMREILLKTQKAVIDWASEKLERGLTPEVLSTLTVDSGSEFAEAINAMMVDYWRKGRDIAAKELPAKIRKSDKVKSVKAYGGIREAKVYGALEGRWNEYVFCPTGPGGGIDNSCGGDGEGSNNNIELTDEKLRMSFDSARFTADDKKAIQGYKDFGFAMTNKFLRHGDTGLGEGANSDASAAIDALDKAFSNSPKLDDDIIVYRGFKSRIASNNSNKLVGKTIDSPAFLSTSLELKSIANFLNDDESVGLKLHVSKGTRAIYTDAISDNKERELLLNRNQKIKITGTTRVDGKIFLEGVLL